jgi:hypothetical protein
MSTSTAIDLQEDKNCTVSMTSLVGQPPLPIQVSHNQPFLALTKKIPSVPPILYNFGGASINVVNIYNNMTQDQPETSSVENHKNENKEIDSKIQNQSNELDSKEEEQRPIKIRLVLK